MVITNKDSIGLVKENNIHSFIAIKLNQTTLLSNNSKGKLHENINYTIDIVFFKLCFW